MIKFLNKELNHRVTEYGVSIYCASFYGVSKEVLINEIERLNKESDNKTKYSLGKHKRVYCSIR